MSAIQLSFPHKTVQGTVTIGGSKSISNRVLMIRALSGCNFIIDNLSESQDTVILDQLLKIDSDVYDAHHAGTTFRFLTAYLALRPGKHVLTGSDRMKQRPIKLLVDVLNQLGADIEYMDKEGYPPLLIKSPKAKWDNTISLPANISSQYVSALLMIAPVLEGGLHIELTGEVVSEAYIEMTISIMKDFGVVVNRRGNSLSVNYQKYQGKDYHVESDWSSASYFYLIAGLSQSVDLTIKGLSSDSVQGDAAIVDIGSKFGVSTTFGNKEIRISKFSDVHSPSFLEYNFLNTPDLAQTVVILCSGKGVQGLFSGLQTLRIKETDRITALQNELAKIQVALMKMPQKFSKSSQIEYYLQEGKAEFATETPVFETYDDHRMAMSLAPLAILHPIIIKNPEVVNKSYPAFWKDLISIGFIVEKVEI